MKVLEEENDRDRAEWWERKKKRRWRKEGGVDMETLEIRWMHRWMDGIDGWIDNTKVSSLLFLFELICKIIVHHSLSFVPSFDCIFLGSSPNFFCFLRSLQPQPLSGRNKDIHLLAGLSFNLHPEKLLSPLVFELFWLLKLQFHQLTNTWTLPCF